MPAANRSRLATLRRDLAAVRAERDDAQQALRAIRNGEVDAVVVPGPAGEQLYSRRGAEQTYRVLVEAMHEGAALLLDEVLAYGNNQLARMVGTPLALMIGAPFSQFVKAERRPALAALIAAARTSATKLEMTLVAADATEVPVLLSVRSVDLDGTRATCLIVTDISALKETEHRFRQLAESLPQLVWTCAPDGACDYVSPQWLAYTGRPEAEQLGAGWLRQTHPDDRAAREWGAAVAAADRFEMNVRIRRFDGVYRWFDTRGTIIRDSAGRAVKWVGSSSDVDDRMQMEHVVRDRTLALERSNSELEQFAFSASHDLQEPLRTITRYTQLLAERCGPQLGEAAGEYMGYIVEGAQRMHVLLNHLLAFSRLSTPTDAMAPTDAGAVAAEAVASLAPVIVEAGAVVEVAPLAEVFADRTQLLTVFQQLIGNAIRFRSAAPPLVRISASSDGALVRFAVSDNGIGIDPAHQERVFTLFQRLNARGAYPGIGAGLAMCRKIVQRHGGTIWIESPMGPGTTFVFTMRAASDEPACRKPQEHTYEPAINPAEEGR